MQGGRESLTNEFRDRGRGFNVLSVHGRKISVGEFVAHLTPFKNFEDLNRALTTLLGKSFMTEVKNVEDPWAKREGGTDAHVLPSHGPVFEDVKALIAVRHQLAHEVPESSPISDLAVLRRQLNSTERFASALAEVVAQTLRPDAPLTQLEMNEAAGRAAADADNEMQELYNDNLGAMVGEARDALEASQAAFVEYRQSASTYAGSEYAGGSIRSMMESLEHERLTRQRTEDLRSLLKLREEAANI